MKITTKEYIDNQTYWVEKIQDEKDLRLIAEAKLREAYISSESRLRESEITALREAIKVFNINLAEYKATANEWRGQLKDERVDLVTTGEHDKDIMSVRQAVNEVNKRLDDKVDPILKYVQESQGGHKVWYFVIALGSALATALILHFLGIK